MTHTFLLSTILVELGLRWARARLLTVPVEKFSLLFPPSAGESCSVLQCCFSGRLYPLDPHQPRRRVDGRMTLFGFLFAILSPLPVSFCDRARTFLLLFPQGHFPQPRGRVMASSFFTCRRVRSHTLGARPVTLYVDFAASFPLPPKRPFITPAPAADPLSPTRS